MYFDAVLVAISTAATASRRPEVSPDFATPGWGLVDAAWLGAAFAARH